MSNPTLNRPAQPVYSAGLNFGATVPSMVAFGATAGFSAELISNTVGQKWEGLTGQGVGYSPRVIPAGFPYTPTPSPCIRMGPGSPGLYYVGCGGKSTDGNVRTYRWWLTDGTSTVYFPGPTATIAPLIARRRKSGVPLGVFYLGDSVREGPSMYTAASTLSRLLDRPVFSTGAASNWSGRPERPRPVTSCLLPNGPSPSLG